MSRFFQLILCTQFIPNRFKRSYIVPIPKPKDTRTEALSVLSDGVCLSELKVLLT